MKWFIRRFFNRIKQKHPIEVYVSGKLIQAGEGTITLNEDRAEIVIKQLPEHSYLAFHNAEPAETLKNLIEEEK